MSDSMWYILLFYVIVKWQMPPPSDVEQCIRGDISGLLSIDSLP